MQFFIILSFFIIKPLFASIEKINFLGWHENNQIFAYEFFGSNSFEESLYSHTLVIQSSKNEILESITSQCTLEDFGSQLEKCPDENAFKKLKKNSWKNIKNYKPNQFSTKKEEHLLQLHIARSSKDLSDTIAYSFDPEKIGFFYGKNRILQTYYSFEENIEPEIKYSFYDENDEKKDKTIATPAWIDSYLRSVLNLSSKSILNLAPAELRVEENQILSGFWVEINQKNSLSNTVFFMLNIEVE